MKATGISHAMTAPGSNRRRPTSSLLQVDGPAAGASVTGRSSTGCEVFNWDSAEPGSESPARAKGGYVVRLRLNTRAPSPPMSTRPRRIGSQIPRPWPASLALASFPVTTFSRADSREPSSSEAVPAEPAPPFPLEAAPPEPPGFVASAKLAACAPSDPWLSSWLMVLLDSPEFEPDPLEVPWSPDPPPSIP